MALNRSRATLLSHDLLYIIRGNGYFSQAVGDTSFPLWAEQSDNSMILLKFGLFPSKLAKIIIEQKTNRVIYVSDANTFSTETLGVG